MEKPPAEKAEGRARIFIDSNVLIKGIVSVWGADRAVLIMAASGVFRLVLADVVKLEVEKVFKEKINQGELRKELLAQYGKLLKLIKPEPVPLPGVEEIERNRRLVAHEADVPVALSAIKAEPDWFVTNNTEHFTREVAKRTGLRIVTPQGFLRLLEIAE